jgi:uncharacterized membrane protein
MTSLPLRVMLEPFNALALFHFIFVHNFIVIEVYIIPTKFSRKRFTGFMELVTRLSFLQPWTMSENKVGRIISVLGVLAM